MSQAGPLSIQSNLPPDIPTSFVTDIQDNFSFVPGTGSSVPDLNIEQILGDNGIQTSANTLTNNVIQIRFNSANVNTVSNETVQAMILPTNTNSTFSTQVLVSGFCSSLGEGVGGNTISTVVNVSGVASLVDGQDYNINTGPSIIDSGFEVTVSGASLIISVIGSLGNPISWSVCTPGQVQT